MLGCRRRAAAAGRDRAGRPPGGRDEDGFVERLRDVLRDERARQHDLAEPERPRECRGDAQRHRRAVAEPERDAVADVPAERVARVGADGEAAPSVRRASPGDAEVDHRAERGRVDGAGRERRRLAPSAARRSPWSRTSPRRGDAGEARAAAATSGGQARRVARGGRSRRSSARAVCSVVCCCRIDLPKKIVQTSDDGEHHRRRDRGDAAQIGAGVRPGEHARPAAERGERQAEQPDERPAPAAARAARPRASAPAPRPGRCSRGRRRASVQDGDSAGEGGQPGERLGPARPGGAGRLPRAARRWGGCATRAVRSRTRRAASSRSRPTSPPANGSQPTTMLQALGQHAGAHEQALLEAAPRRRRPATPTRRPRARRAAPRRRPSAAPGAACCRSRGRARARGGVAGRRARTCSRRRRSRRTRRARRRPSGRRRCPRG